MAHSDFGDTALNNAIASYRKNREIWLREKAKQIREERMKAEQEALACSGS